MTYAILDPSLLYISEESWLDEELRDDYISHFSELISSIDNEDNVDIAWSELMDELMWESPIQLPWKKDKFWSQTLIPQIYRKMENNFDRLNTNNSGCDINPEFSITRDDFYSEFKKILVEVYPVNFVPFIALGKDNIEIKERNYIHNRKNLNPSPNYIISKDCFLKEIDLENTMWPINKDDSATFESAISIKIKRDLNNSPILYKFKFSKPFIKRIANERDDRDKILTSVARRLILNSNDASKDPCLQDESLSKSERRLRVTPRPSSKRIHYNKVKDTLEFTTFYGASEHDDGL